MAEPDKTTEPNKHWTTGLAIDTLRESPSLKRYASVEDMSQGYLNLENKLRQRGVTLPKDGASPAEIRAAMTELGCPPEPGKYNLGEWQPPKDMPWDAELVQTMQETAWQHGLTDKQWVPMLQAFEKRQRDQFTQTQQAARARMDEGRTKLKERWGHAVEDRLAVAKSAIEALFGQDADAVAYLDLGGDRLLGNQPAFLETMYKLGEVLRDQQLIAPTLPASTGGKLTPAEAQSEITRLNADKEWTAALFDAHHPKHGEVMKQRDALYHAAYNLGDPRIDTERRGAIAR